MSQEWSVYRGEPTLGWWEGRRGAYNKGLVRAGLGAFLCLALLVPLDESPVFGAVFYLFMMAIANVCYFLGPLSEALIRPRDVYRFRQRVYAVGYWFSVALPFGIPSLALFLKATDFT